MKVCVLLRCLASYLSLLLLSSCLGFFSPAPEEMKESFFYDDSGAERWEEFRYEWIPADQILPWKFYYGLVYWRFRVGEKVGFALPYFLIQDLKGQNYPDRFTLSHPNGISWRFYRINTKEDLLLPYHSKPSFPVDPTTPFPQIDAMSAIEERPPFQGRVYVMDPFYQEALNWSTLRLLYEETTQNNSFRFVWEDDNPTTSPLISEPDRTIFPLKLSQLGFQIFMSTLKRWGIS